MSILALGMEPHQTSVSPGWTKVLSPIDIALRLDFRNADPSNAVPADAERVPAALIIKCTVAGIPAYYISACTWVIRT
jgi:hypothetical protein